MTDLEFANLIISVPGLLIAFATYFKEEKE